MRTKETIKLLREVIPSITEEQAIKLRIPLLEILYTIKRETIEENPKFKKSLEDTFNSCFEIIEDKYCDDKTFAEFKPSSEKENIYCVNGINWI